MLKRMVLVLAMVAVGCGGEEAQPKGESGGLDVDYTGTRESVGGVSVVVPAAWTKETPTSQMRAAQYRLPGEGSGDAELVVFYFGAGNAGSVDANLERWRGQVSGDDPGTVTKRTVQGMPVTVLDVKGTYSASMGPMMQGGAAMENYYMVAAIVESPTGAYYFKLTGPEPTVTHWRDTFRGFVNSAEKAQ